MIVYEVTLVVQRRIEAQYRAWLAEHIREILLLPGFRGAEVFERVEPESGPDQFALCVHYRLEDAAALAEYFATHAPRLRADGINRFGDGFRAERRVLRPSASY